mmetsp:Transcript_58110/g.138248  ORF Transcript_58110/g.138248 Transcript_58110/m.138248 type:complete len:643 (-) Transcript_58110:58-1986(-)
MAIFSWMRGLFFRQGPAGGSSRCQVMFSALVVGGASLALYDHIRMVLSGLRKWIVGDKCAPSQGKPLRRRIKIAILGGGIGASAVALWLRDALGGENDLDLVVISDSPIGGRCKTVACGSEQYEIGSDLSCGAGLYFASLLRRLGLKQQPLQRTHQAYSVIDGSRLLFCTTGASALRSWHVVAWMWSQVQLVMRYGFWPLLQLRSLAHGASGPCTRRLYDALQEGASFAHPRELLAVLGHACLRLTGRSTEDWLVREQGLPRQLVSEIVEPVLRAMYGQGCADVHAAALLVMLPMLRLWWGVSRSSVSVVGGIQQVPKLAFDAAAPRMLKGTVRVVRRKKLGAPSDCEPRFEVAYVDASASRSSASSKAGEAQKGKSSNTGSRRAGEAEGLLTEMFHLVVLAQPIETSDVDFEGCCASISIEPGGGKQDTNAASPSGSGPLAPQSFQACWVHLVQGSPNLRCIVGEGADAEDPADGVGGDSNSRIQRYFMDHRGDGRAPVPSFLPTRVLTTANSSTPFYAFGIRMAVSLTQELDDRAAIESAERAEAHVYRVVAPRRLTSEELSAWFHEGRGQTEVVVDSFAIPRYSVPQPYRPFVLDPEGVFYVSAMEQVASTLETTLIASRNVTNLIIDWVDQRRGPKQF